ncbi:hypothetical protein [Glaciihabitans sp. dw_435]|uniref:hypothetical protein n=1 Tax=Glaciihabitans sp. dw_435 TaxID=2720081 RepID=UPI001BD6418B|nr:hypothetical protein [Glaciihabitans sp. dw_435]
MRFPRLLTAAVLGTALAVGLGGGPVAAADPEHIWSLTMLDGSPATTGSLFDDRDIVPGSPMTSGYLISRTDDIDGPVEVRAIPISTDPDLASDLLVTAGINGVPGQTQRLDTMLSTNAAVVATTAIPVGQVRLDISVQLDPASVNVTRLSEVAFRFEVRVSDVDIVIPPTAGNSTPPTPPTSTPSATTSPTVTPSPTPAPEPTAECDAQVDAQQTADVDDPCDPSSPTDPGSTNSPIDTAGGPSDPQGPLFGFAEGGLALTGSPLQLMPLLLGGLALIFGAFMVIRERRDRQRAETPVVPAADPERWRDL